MQVAREPCKMPRCLVLRILCSLFLTALYTLHVAVATHLLPVSPPVQCNSTGGGCTVQNYQGIWADRKPCKAAKAIYPSSEADLFQAVALASKTGSKAKMVSKGSHSFPKLVCPGGEDGLLISTQHYNSLIHVNLTSLRVTAHAGVMLRDLLDTIAQYGLALPHTPVWQEVSVAGLISTGAHGSGMWGKGSAVHEYVVGMRLIIPASEEDGYAKIIELHEEDEDLHAARLSLGVLGAISHVTFQLEPMFKRSVTFEIRGDEGLDDGLLQFAKEHEFGEISWYPASRKALFKLDGRVDVETEGEGEYHMAVLDKLEVAFIESSRNELEAAEESQSLGELCQEAIAVINSRQSSGNGLLNNGVTFTGYPVVGFNHKMQTSGVCEREDTVLPIITPTGVDFIDRPTHDHHLHMPSSEEDVELADKGNTPSVQAQYKLVTCLWNPALIKAFSFFDTAITIPASKFKDAIADIKKLRDIDPEPFCGLAYIIGIWIRFLSSSKAYLGEPSDAIVFELMYYRSKDPATPRLHEGVFEEIEQMLLYKFGGKPHWGKNRDLAFEDMRSRTRALEKFLEVRQRFDPSGVFSSEWTDAILGIPSTSRRGVQTFQDHCALEGLCVCKADSHCHPTKGYFCRPGRVYKEARVCLYEKQASSI